MTLPSRARAGIGDKLCMVHMEIKKETVDKVLGYLGTRPYREVYMLIAEIAEQMNKNNLKAEQNGEPRDKRDSSKKR